MRYLPLPGQFRKTYAYSNFGYTTGAIAAATKIGKPWETIADEQLYSRLGMTSTSSRFSDYENRANKAALHIFLNGQPVNRFVREADAESPAGGVSSMPAISPSGYGSSSIRASGTASRSSTRTRLPRPTRPRSVAQRPTRQSPMTAPAANTTASAGTSGPMRRAVRN